MKIRNCRKQPPLIFPALCLLVLLALVSCDYKPSSSEVEHAQQEGGIQAMLRNQPVPTLTYSMERQIVTETYLARNRKMATWTYTRDMQGRITEICPSMGYPIPYSTQLTNPSQLATTYANTKTGASNHSIDGVIGNPEPTGLYPPAASEATLVSCVEPDGAVVPTYWEDRVFAMPYRIKADFKLQRADTIAPSFSVKVRD